MMKYPSLRTARLSRPVFTSAYDASASSGDTRQWGVIVRGLLRQRPGQARRVALLFFADDDGADEETTDAAILGGEGQHEALPLIDANIAPRRVAGQDRAPVGQDIAVDLDRPAREHAKGIADLEAGEVPSGRCGDARSV